LFYLLAAIAYVISVFPMLAQGNGDKNDLEHGYFSNTKPAFTDSDYMNTLNSSSEEMQYNGICYFKNEATFVGILTTK
jgi:hypothetical protein